MSPSKLDKVQNIWNVCSGRRKLSKKLGIKDVQSRVWEKGRKPASRGVHAAAGADMYHRTFSGLQTAVSALYEWRQRPGNDTGMESCELHLTRQAQGSESMADRLSGMRVSNIQHYS